MAAPQPLAAHRAAPDQVLNSKSTTSGRWSEAMRARGEKGAVTAVTTISGLVKQWSMRMAGKLDGKVLTEGRSPSAR